MNVLLVMACAAAILFLGGMIYPRWIGRVFGENDANPTPAVRFADGKDFVKSPSHVVFGHHFASIAGAGPIVGPILALAYGWGPAWLWLVIGGIFFGAVHDMTSMFVSVRENGRTIADIARRTLGNAGYLLFVSFLLIVISFVNAIFLKLSAAALASMYPLESLGLASDQTLLRTEMRDGVLMGRIGGIATTSVIVMTLTAPLIGLIIRAGKLHHALIYSICGLICAAGVVIGFYVPVSISPDAWMLLLAAYVAMACWVPVWLLLQPRDFMNVQLLYGGMLLLVLATIVAGVQGQHMQLAISSIEAGERTKGLGPIWPVMFITIACGAISGFHSLVATGTTVRQIPLERDCRRIGFGAMLLETMLAILVLVAVASQMSSAQYRASMDSPGGAILTFAVGSGRMFEHLGIPMAIGCVLGILVIEGFIVTTLDTAVRLARYLFEELWACLFARDSVCRACGYNLTNLASDRCPECGAALVDGEARRRLPAMFRHPLFNTACAVGAMLLFAYSQEAYKALWPFFGAGNQLIGALALTTVSIWLLQRGKPCWFTAVPAVFMVATAVTALAYLVLEEVKKEGEPLRWIIVGAGALLLALSAGFVVIAGVRVVQACRRVSREPAVS